MKERLIYLDAAKGIGMLLIVCAHTGADTHIPMLGDVKVALFFILSALFFMRKKLLNTKEFLCGDVQRLLVPFLVFYAISYLLFYMGMVVLPGFHNMTEARGIFDCFTQKQYFNGPIWFLLCLFWVRLFCFFLEKFISNEWIKSGNALLIGLFGFLLGKYEVDLPLTIDTALTYTPVFYVGILLNKFAVFDRYNRIESGVFSPILYMSCIPVTMSIQDSVNRYGGGYICLLYNCLILTIAIIFFCKALLNKSILLSFIGRNSMWIMCTHHLIYRPIKLVIDRTIYTDYNNYMVFLITLIVCCLTAPLVEKYLPVIVGIKKK